MLCHIPDLCRSKVKHSSIVLWALCRKQHCSAIQVKKERLSHKELKISVLNVSSPAVLMWARGCTLSLWSQLCSWEEAACLSKVQTPPEGMLYALWQLHQEGGGGVEGTGKMQWRGVECRGGGGRLSTRTKSCFARACVTTHTACHYCDTMLSDWPRPIITQSSQGAKPIMKWDGGVVRW